MARRLFLDFDGTLIDSRRRLYSLFCELAPESEFSFEQYWEYKRNNTSQRTLLRERLKYSDERIAIFKKDWMEKVEEPDRLALDILQEGVSEFLYRSSQSLDLFLVTGRQHLDLLLQQLRLLGIHDFFSDVFNTAQSQSKANLIRSKVSWDADDMLVGDTGEDILAGKELGVRTVAVTSGALCEQVLRKYDPDIVIQSVNYLET